MTAIDAPTFAALGVPHPLVEVLARAGKTTAFPIQTDTLADTLAGRDVLGRGRTGSGKTLAFSIPMVARLGTRLAGGARRPNRPLGLILAPTRELATQIAATVTPLAEAYGLNVTTIFGGVSQQRQVAALRSGVDIVVACPGRLEDLMKQGFANLDSVEITVLDEADHMADLGFLPGVTRIMSATPAGGQRMLFSATLDNGVDKLVSKFLHDPKHHSVDEASTPVAQMEHHLFSAADAAVKQRIVEALASGTGRRILFLRTKHRAKKLARDLTARGIPAVELQGNLSQAARERNLAAFADGSVRVLVATDVAARGVHVDDIELVIHVDPPVEHKAYLHRSGRTARAGKEGDVVTLILPEQERDVAAIMRKADIRVAPQRVMETSEAVIAIIGEVAPRVEPSAAPVAAPQGGRSGGRGGRPAGAASRSNGASGRSDGASGRSNASSAGRGRRGGAGGGRSGDSAQSRGQAQRADVARRGQHSHDAKSSQQIRGTAGSHHSAQSSAPAGGARRPSRRAARPQQSSR